MHPSMEKGHSVGRTSPSHIHTNNFDFPTCGAHSKAQWTVIASLALHGHEVHQIPRHGFFVCKYGFAQHCHDFAALTAFAERLGVI